MKNLVWWWFTVFKIIIPQSRSKPLATNFDKGVALSWVLENNAGSFSFQNLLSKPKLTLTFTRLRVLGGFLYDKHYWESFKSANCDKFCFSNWQIVYLYFSY